MTMAEIVAIDRRGELVVEVTVRRGDALCRYAFTRSDPSAGLLVEYDDEFNGDFFRPQDLEARTVVLKVVRRAMRGEGIELPVALPGT